MRIPEIIKVGVPIVVSVISLLFGAFQYFDKRDLERTLQMQLIEQNAAALIDHYMHTKFEMMGPLDQDLSTIAVRWLGSQSESLRLGKLDLIETPNFNTISGEVPVFPWHREGWIGYFVIRNIGRARAEQISLTFDVEYIEGTPEYTESLWIDVIEPGSGVALVASAYYEGGPLIPAIIPRTLSYVDASTGRTFEQPVREELEHPRLIAPGLYYKGDSDLYE